MNYIFTTCALNFLPAAKALLRSIERKLPNSKKIICITDRLPDDFVAAAEGIDELITLHDLMDELGNVDSWVFRHDVMELATAVKPFVLDRLLKRPDCGSVMFFDCDCVIYGKLQPIFDALGKASIALTPHACQAHLRSDWVFFELNTLRVGVFNLGFFAVKNTDSGVAFARWWKERLRDYCVIDPSRFLFTDQKWIDLVPCYFDDVAVLRQPTLNLARWNTFQRLVTRRADGTLLADGDPVEFVHFSGFSKIGDYVHGLYDRRTAPFCRDREVLDDLSKWYAAEIAADQARPLCRAPWGFGTFDDGTPIPKAARDLYRSNEKLAARFPTPFAASGKDSFRAFYERRAPGSRNEPPAEPAGDEISLLRLRADRAERKLAEIEKSRIWKIARAIGRKG